MPPLSPKTQYAMQGAPGPQDAEAIFEEKFGQLAQNHLVTKHPELADMILMFTVVNTDLDQDIGVGTFVLEIGGNEVHIPVVIDRGRLAPLDIMYSKMFDTFLPLSPEWIDYLMSEDSSQFGTAQKPPKTLQTDVDIRNLVVPPMTGRYSYASADGDLMDVLTLLPNKVKTAFLSRLQGSRKLAEHVLTRYGQQRLALATAPVREKSAAAIKLAAIEFFGIDTPLNTLKSAFGEQTPAAYAHLRKQGYVMLDRRPDPKVAYFTEYVGRHTTPSSPGFYEITLRDGETRHAYVTTKPVLLTRNAPYARNASPEGRPLPRNPSPRPFSESNVVWVFTDRGELLSTDEMGLPITTIGDNEEPLEDQRDRIFPAKLRGEPKEGLGFFCGYHGTDMVVSQPLMINSVTLRSNGTYVLEATCDGQRIVIRKGPDANISKIHVGRHGSFPEVRVPNDYSFVRVKKHIQPSMVVTSPEEAREIQADGWARDGSSKIEVVKKAGVFAVNGSPCLDAVDALRQLVVTHDFSEKSAHNLLKMAALTGHCSAARAGRRLLLKLAMGEEAMPQDPAMMDPAMQDPAMMDPAMMDPTMMPPSPLEQAAMEISQVLQAQTEEVMAQMQQQASMFEAQVQAINMMMGRAEELMGGAPPLEYADIRGNAQGSVPPAMPVGMPPEGLPPAGAMPPMPQPDPMGGGMTEGPMGGDMLETAVDVENQFPGQEPGAFDTSAIAALVAEDGLEDMATQQLPKFRDALDGVAQTLFEMRIKAPLLREELGEQRYDDITSKLRKVLTAFGSVLLSLYRNANILVPAEMKSVGGP